jgi:hypothetical protein
VVREARESDSDGDGDATREPASISHQRARAFSSKNKTDTRKKGEKPPNAQTNHERVDPPSWPKPMKASPCGCDCYRERVKRV